MITKQEFFKVISEHQQFNDAIERMSNSIGQSVYLFETDWCQAEGNLFDIFLKSHFTDEAVDTIYWWLYEDVDKIIYTDEKSIPVRTLGQLWNFFNIEPKVYFKSV